MVKYFIFITLLLIIVLTVGTRVGYSVGYTDGTFKLIVPSFFENAIENTHKLLHFLPKRCIMKQKSEGRMVCRFITTWNESGGS